MKEEDKIPKKEGTENPFRIPDGYFGNLTSEVMGRLPEKKKPALPHKEPTTWEKVRPWLYIAAISIGAAIIIRIARDNTDTEIEYINTIVDNSMLDDYSLYVYLTDVDGEPDKN